MKLVAADHVDVAFGDRSVLKDVSLECDSGEIVALIGHNAAGKTTLLRVLAGQLAPAKGSITVGGEAVPQPLSRRVSYVPQATPVFDTLTVAEHFAFRFRLAGLRASRRLVLTAISEHAPALSRLVNERARYLSGGERRLLGVACAAAAPAPVLLLDEPLLGADGTHRAILLRLIKATTKARGLGTLVVEHHVREVLEIADRVVILRNGSISYSGPASEVSDAVLADHFL